MSDDTPNFTKRQLDALELLKKHYPSGVGIADSDARAVFDSIIERGTGLVELIDSDETPTGDCYRLTDAGAMRFVRMLRKEPGRRSRTDEPPERVIVPDSQIRQTAGGAYSRASSQAFRTPTTSSSPCTSQMATRA